MAYISRHAPPVVSATSMCTFGAPDRTAASIALHVEAVGGTTGLMTRPPISPWASTVSRGGAPDRATAVTRHRGSLTSIEARWTRPDPGSRAPACVGTIHRPSIGSPLPSRHGGRSSRTPTESRPRHRLS